MRFLKDRQLFFYTLPALDMIPSNVIKPIRHVVAIAVDEQHLRRPAPRIDAQQQGEPVDFCVIRRSAISLFTLRDKLWFQKARSSSLLLLLELTHYAIV